MRGVVVVGGTGSAVSGQPPFQPNFGPPAVDQGPFYGNQPFPPGQPFPGQGFPYDANPYDNFPPGVIPPIGNPGGPGFATTLTATVAPNGSVALNWVPIPNAVSYRVYNTNASTPLNLQVATTVNQGLGGAPVSQATLTGLTPGQAYLFQVRAVDANGIESVIPIASPQAGPGAPQLPAGPLTVTATTGNSVTLTWSPLPGATSYRVLQSSAPGGPFTISSVGTTSQTTATVSGLTLNTTYFFQVVPLDAIGNQGPPTNTVSAQTTLTLTAPTNVIVVSTTNNTATLSWAAATGANTYRVLTATSPLGPFAQANALNITGSGATVTGLIPGTTYYFQVVALDAASNQSQPSVTVFGQTPL